MLNTKLTQVVTVYGQEGRVEVEIIGYGWCEGDLEYGKHRHKLGVTQEGEFILVYSCELKNEIQRPS